MVALQETVMSDPETPVGDQELQFDRVVPESSSAHSQGNVGMVCSACHEPIPTEYYDINGNVVCQGCRLLIEAAAETPRGVAPFLTAALGGLGAGIVGAIIYFAVIYFAKLEIGLVAILIGYMVGYSVRRGAGGRGGLRFQVLAVALTYASIALAYAPVVVMSAANASREAQTAATTTGPTGTSAQPVASGRPIERSPQSALVVVAILLAFIAALPVLVVWGSFPSGLISALIIVIGMRQAWRMTGALQLSVFGPYQVGASIPGSM
jgi:hypothetical protein